MAKHLSFSSRADFGALIPADLDDFGLDPFSFRVYCRVARRAGSGVCNETLEKMAVGCRMSKRKVQDALKLLTDCGFLGKEDFPGFRVHYSLLSRESWSYPQGGTTC